MQREPVHQNAKDAGLFWRGCACRLFQKDLFLSLDELKSVAVCYGYTPESINRLIRQGFLPEEIEELLYEESCYAHFGG